MFHYWQLLSIIFSRWSWGTLNKKATMRYEYGLTVWLTIHQPGTAHMATAFIMTGLLSQGDHNFVMRVDAWTKNLFFLSQIIYVIPFRQTIIFRWFFCFITWYPLNRLLIILQFRWFFCFITMLCTYNAFIRLCWICCSNH